MDNLLECILFNISAQKEKRESKKEKHDFKLVHPNVY